MCGNMHCSTTLLMQAICIFLQFQFIKNSSFFVSTLEDKLNFKIPSGSAVLEEVSTARGQLSQMKSSEMGGVAAASSPTANSTGKSITADNLPAAFDWRDRHKVTSVRDQSQCNACYAFAVTSAIESALAIQYDINIDTTTTSSATVNASNSTASNSSSNLHSVHMVNMNVASTKNEHYVNLNLSVQQLIDCTFMTNRSSGSNASSSSSAPSGYRNNACQYGYIEDTFRYVAENGLLPEDLYPYEMQKSNCRPFPLYTNRTFISGYEKKLNLSTSEIKKLIYQKGPIISLINDKGLEFLNYKGGIIKNGKNKNSFKIPTHAILIIGWGSENSTTYWILKNSWSTQWGEMGFARIQVATRGIGKYIFYPLLEETRAKYDPFRTVIVYIFLAVLITSMLSFYIVAQICSSAFFDRTKIRSEYFRVAYSKPKLKFEVNG